MITAQVRLLTLVSRYRRTAGHAFVIESVAGELAIKVTEGTRDPEALGTLKASGEGVVFKPAAAQRY